MLELRHFRYFIAVAETLHFGQAASRLHISQPPLSMQIRQLEEILGVELFLRSKRKVSLTEAGRVFQEEAQRVLQAAEVAVESARQAGLGLRGRLRVGFVSSAPFSLLPRVLEAHRRAYPEVTLVLTELGSAEQLRALQDGRLDVGLVRMPAQATGVEIEVVAREALLAALPGAHPLAQQSHLELSQLRDEPFVIFPRAVGPGLYDRILGLCAQAGFLPRIIQEIEQMHAVVGLVGAGLGVSLVPESMQIIKTPGVVYRSLEGNPTTEMALAYRSGPLQPLQSAFLELAR